MSFGSFIKKISDPRRAWAPASVATRSSSMSDAITGRSLLDPTGRVLVRPNDPVTPAARTPYVSKLSPGAQAIKDRMLARRNGTAPPVTPRSGGTGFAATAAPRAAPQVQMSNPRALMDASGYGLGEGYRDGGQVKKNSSSKVFARKPNGKPF